MRGRPKAPRACPARPIHLSSCALAVCLLTLSISCAGTRHKSAPPAPTSGLIEYRETSPQPGLLGRGASPPQTVAFFVGKDDVIETIDAFQGDSGRLPDSMAERGITASDVRGIFGTHTGGVRRPLPPERFAELWARLGEAGFFEMPRSRLEAAPRGAPYFVVRSGEERWIVPRPEVQLPAGIAAGDKAKLKAWADSDPAYQAFEAWRRSKLAFFDFLNER